MTDNEGGAADKRTWPDMRSLRWPPEGVEHDPEVKVKTEDMPPPVEFAADPTGSGELVPVPVGGHTIGVTITRCLGRTPLFRWRASSSLASTALSN